MPTAPYPVVRAPSGSSRLTFLGRIPPTPRPGRDWATVTRAWGDAFVHFDARVRTILDLARACSESSSNPASDWCVACLTDLRSAIYELHAWLLREPVTLTPHGPAVVAYLSEAYVWCGDVLDDVEALLKGLRNGSKRCDATAAEDSVGYIEEFLCPLLGQVPNGHPRTVGFEPPTPSPRALVQRLHMAIVSLSWTLAAN